jgi:hypothetical protein
MQARPRTARQERAALVKGNCSAQTRLTEVAVRTYWLVMETIQGHEATTSLLRMHRTRCVTRCLAADEVDGPYESLLTAEEGYL